MSYAPAPSLLRPSQAFGTNERDMIGHDLLNVGSGSASSIAWPVANTALYVPVTLAEAITLAQFFTHNGSSVAGNVDLGLYDQSWARIVSTGEVAESGTSVVQAFDVTDTPVRPGRYYLACARSSTSSTPLRYSVNQVTLASFGVWEEASAVPLPATAAPTRTTRAYLPIFGLTQKGVL